VEFPRRHHVMSKLRSRQHRPTGNQLQFPAASESGAAAARSASACLRPMCARSRDTPPSIACRKAGNSDPVRSNLLLCLIDASTSATATSCGLTALAFPTIAAGQLHVPKLVDRFNLATHRTLPHVAVTMRCGLRKLTNSLPNARPNLFEATSCPTARSNSTTFAAMIASRS
jgi:hypothetical protein